MIARKGRATTGMRAVLALALALGWLAALPTIPARAAALIVTVTADDDDGTCNAHCSLREALSAAAASPGHDTITFALPGAGPWTLYLQTTPTITQDLTIRGPGREWLFLDGGYDGFGGNRIFAIGAGAVTIEHLTLTNGYAGAAWGGCLFINGGSLTLRDARVLACQTPTSGGGGLVISGGTVVLDRVEMRGNVAGHEPVYGGGGGAVFANQYYGHTSLTIRDSVIAGNAAVGSDGGALKTDRLMDRPNTSFPYRLTLTIERSTIGGLAHGDGNTARWGGGLYVNNPGDTATLTDTTIAGNVAASFGGGLYLFESPATLTNVTVSGNAAHEYSGGGIFVHHRSVATLRFSTVVGNIADRDNNGTGIAGGLHGDGGTLSGSTINLLGTIVAGNRKGAATPDDCYANSNSDVTSLGYNLTGSDPECPAGNTDLTYTGALAALLDPALALNAPGTTPTHALTATSPARDRVQANLCPVSNDQRGVLRNDGRCDIGAHEYVAPATNPSPSPGAPVALTVTAVGAGTVGRSPAGSGNGPFSYATGNTVTLTPQPDPGQTFVGWAIDGVNEGWAPSLTLTMDAPHTVQATFAPVKSFPDVPAGRADHEAIIALASRGTIFGYGTGNYGPDDGVQRAQMAALIARATSAGPDTPPTMLTPPACLAGGTWDCEDWGNSFTDRSGDLNLWRNAGVLQHYGVALGYTAADCAGKGRTFPCYGPNDPVSYAQTITFITRMMKVKGYWVMQPNAPLPYANVPGPHAEDIRTFAFYTQALGGIPAPPDNWNANTTRGWFARALWAALNSYWGTGGIVP